jgi:putative ribosome biogenesis GTPase RsgA
MLYGDSGSGKSSLINAGLVPEAIRLGFTPERLRVQPRSSEEIVGERIAGADDGVELPSV